MQLESTNIGWEFERYKYESTQTTFIIVEAPPGKGVRLHIHPYKEIFIILEGTALFTIEGKVMEIGCGNIVIVPPDTAHKFINSGTGLLKQVDIHITDRFITNWLKN